jgi:hypothetical protein
MQREGKFETMHSQQHAFTYAAANSPPGKQKGTAVVLSTELERGAYRTESTGNIFQLALLTTQCYKNMKYVYSICNRH